MDAATRNLLYRRPELYERFYPEPDESTPRFCQVMFARHLGRPAQSILDMGCGTGRDLRVLARGGVECWGVDYLDPMIEHARKVRSELNLRVGDMRDVRLGRRFDAILCLGSVITYALSDEDLDATLATFAAHAQPGGVLVLDLVNAAGFLEGGCFQPHQRFRVSRPGLSGEVEVTCRFDRPQQQMVRERTWRLDDGSVHEDFCRYRLLFPMELSHRLKQAGFEVVDMFDSKQMKETDLNSGTLYVAARFEVTPKAGDTRASERDSA